IDRLGPRLQIFRDRACSKEDLKLLYQDREFLTETCGRFLETRFVRELRKIGDLGKDGLTPFALCLFALSLLAFLALLTLSPFAFLDTVPAFLFAFALFLLGALLLGTVLASLQLAAVFARLPLGFLDDGLDHRLKLGRLDAVLGSSSVE